MLLRGDAAGPFSEALFVVLRMEKGKDQSYETRCNQHGGLMLRRTVLGKIPRAPSQKSHLWTIPSPGTQNKWNEGESEAPDAQRPGRDQALIYRREAKITSL